MESPISIRDTEIPLQMQNIIDASTASYIKSLHSLRATAQETARFQLDEVKAKLRETEDDFVKALAVKTRKEAKRMALMDVVASAKARVEDLSASIRDHRTKKQEYAAFISLALAASKGKLNESIERKDETQVISWYNRVLGFQVKGGRGVKFTFKNININNPDEEYFLLFHETDTYSWNLVVTTDEHEESAFNSASAPVLSMSSVRRDFLGKENEHQAEPTEGNKQFKKQNVHRRLKSSVLSPGSASSVCQSPRLKV
uniref:Kinetochore protein SPC25 n=1 Tax=Glycine max TaxID=3847 RepID=A0A0R0FIT7_SOYBN